MQLPTIKLCNDDSERRDFEDERSSALPSFDTPPLGEQQVSATPQSYHAHRPSPVTAHATDLYSAPCWQLPPQHPPSPPCRKNDNPTPRATRQSVPGWSEGARVRRCEIALGNGMGNTTRGKGEWEEEEEVCDRGSIGSAHCGVQVVAWVLESMPELKATRRHKCSKGQECWMFHST